MIWKLVQALVLAIVAVVPSAGLTEAQPMKAELVSVALVSEVQAIQPAKPFWVAVQLSMMPGWHVNWRNPGDAGLAPSVRWSLPDGFEAGEVMWPYPSRFALPELAIYGYEKEVWLLARITPPDALPEGTTVSLQARVDWLACREACVPGSSAVALSLRAAGSDASPAKPSPAFERARSLLPLSATDWQLGALLDDARIVITVHPPAGFAGDPGEVAFFPTEPGIIEAAGGQELTRDEGGYRLSVERSLQNPDPPRRITGVLVSAAGWGKGGAKALDVDIPIGN